MLSQVILWGEGSSVQASVGSLPSIPGMEQISGRKRTTVDKSLCLPVARVLCVHFNMGVCHVGGSTSAQTTTPGSRELGSHSLFLS